MSVPPRRLLILVILYALPGAWMAYPVLDEDIWWHLRTGAWIVEHHNVPISDPFSHNSQGTPWIAYSWLFALLVHGLQQIFGLSGLLGYRLVVSYLFLLSLHRFILRREPRFLPASVYAALAFMAVAPVLTERPWLFTFLFGVWTLDAVLLLREGKATRLIWCLPIVYALWGNLHIQFLYGLILLGLGCTAPLFDRLFGLSVPSETAGTFGSRGWRALVALTVACTLAPLLNPYGIKLYTVIFDYAGQKVTYDWIRELLAPSFRREPDWALLALALAAAFSLGRRARLSTFDILLLAGTAFTAFRTRRDSWFLVLGAVTVLSTLPRGSQGTDEGTHLPRSAWAFIAAGALAIVACWVAGRGLSERTLIEAVGTNFPARAVAHIRDSNYQGPLFNTFDWGGYLVWALPEHPVGIDGRNNLHGDARLHRQFRTERGLDIEEDDILKTARLVLVGNETPLPALLRKEKRFREAYRDEIATVFVAVD